MAPANVVFYCRREEEEREFFFFSNVGLEEAQLKKTIDVICSSEKDGSSIIETVERVFNICIPTANKGFVEIEGEEDGRVWLITVNGE